MAFRTLRIADVEPIAIDGLTWHPLRHALDVRGFGVNAYSAAAAGDELIEDHTEADDDDGGGPQELYVVISGRARFTIDGEDVDVPAGNLVFLPEPRARRHAVAEEPGTTVLAVGADPGRPYEVSAWEWRFRAAPHVDAEDWEQAAAIVREGLAAHPGDANSLYDLACIEARRGRLDEAAALLRESVAAEPEKIRRWGAEDADLDPLRDRPDFPL